MAIDMEEIIEKRPHHPLATTMLLINVLALLGAILFVGLEGKYYVNGETRDLVEAEGTQKALEEAKDWLKREKPDWLKGEGESAGPRRRGRGADEEG